MDRIKNDQTNQLVKIEKVMCSIEDRLTKVEKCLEEQQSSSEKKLPRTEEDDMALQKSVQRLEKQMVLIQQNQNEAHELFKKQEKQIDMMEIQQDLKKILENQMVQASEREFENEIEECGEEKTTAMKRSKSIGAINISVHLSGNDEASWETSSIVNVDREALRRVLKKEIPKTHRQGDN